MNGRSAFGTLVSGSAQSGVQTCKKHARSHGCVSPDSALGAYQTTSTRRCSDWRRRCPRKEMHRYQGLRSSYQQLRTLRLKGTDKVVPFASAHSCSNSPHERTAFTTCANGHLCCVRCPRQARTFRRGRRTEPARDGQETCRTNSDRQARGGKWTTGRSTFVHGRDRSCSCRRHSRHRTSFKSRLRRMGWIAFTSGHGEGNTRRHC